MYDTPCFPRLAALLLALLVPASVFAGAPSGAGATAASVAKPVTETLPDEPLTERALYEFLVGELALQRGQTALAAHTYLDLARRTRDPRIARRAVEIASYAHAPQLALEAAKIWHQADPNSPLPLQTVIALLIGMHQVDNAEPYITQLLSLNSAAVPHSFVQLHRLLAANPDKEANLKLVQHLAAHYPKLAEAHFAVARAAFVAGEDSLALSEAQSASEIRPGWGAAAILEAEILRQTSRMAAEARLADFLGKHPDSRDVRLAYARLLVSEQQYAEARTQFEKLLAVHPEDQNLILAVGLLSAQLKDYAAADTQLKKLIALGYRNIDGVRLALGQVAEDQRDWPRAIEWYKKVDTGPQYLASRIRIAHVLAQEGELAQARHYLHNLKVGNEHQRIQLIIAEADLLREAKRYRAAFDVLGKALTAHPDDPDLLYDYALAADKIDRIGLVESSLRKLIKLRPDSAQAYNALGYSLADRDQQLPEARQLIEKALKLDPNDSYIIDSMGWVLYRMGDLKAAEAQLRRAWQGREDPEIGAHLGEVLWIMGQREQARSVWSRALKNGPHNETLRATMRRFGVH